jgi:hypothetical protein
VVAPRRIGTLWRSRDIGAGGIPGSGRTATREICFRCVRRKVERYLLGSAAMKRIALRLAAAVFLAGLFGRCDTSDCDDCDDAHDKCVATCAGFEACERCEDAYDSCLETCGSSQVETSC